MTAAAATVRSPTYFVSKAIIVPSVTMNPPGMKEIIPDRSEEKKI